MKIKDKSKKMKKYILLVLLLTLFGCTSWFEPTGKVAGLTFIRSIAASTIISTYKIKYNRIPKNETEIDTFINSNDFLCYDKQDFGNIYADSLFSSLELLNSNDTLQQYRIYFKPFTIENAQVNGCGVVITIYPIRPDSTFEFSLDSLNINYFESRMIKPEGKSKMTSSIIKCK